MKKLRQTKAHVYPAGTLGSLKGDDFACVRYLEKRSRSSRRRRRYRFWYESSLLALFGGGPE